LVNSSCRISSDGLARYDAPLNMPMKERFPCRAVGRGTPPASVAGGDPCGRHWTEHQYPNAQGDRRPRAGMPLTLPVPSKIFTIFEATSEIQRMLIGRTVTGLDV
jgi:hypothetical protein